MNKTLLTISAIALSSGTAAAYNSDANANNNYIKLASISPIVESDHNMVVNQNFDLSTPLDPANPTDPDHPINEACVAKGYDVVGGCAATGDCIPDYCPENPLYMACTCFCAVNACTDNGYTEQTCTKYDTETDCPMLPNQGYVKCDEMEGFEKCIVDEYYEANPNCTGYTIAENCTYDATYKKCVAMDDEEKCNKDGYNLSSCPSGKELTDKCPHGSENLYKNCVVSDCAPQFVTSCAAGYKLDTSNSCTDSNGTKYLCMAEDCTGYDQTSPCSPVDGYSQSTCLSGSTTKYMCIANACTGYNQTSCLPVKGYSSIETCKSGSTTKYKCTMNDCEAYFYTGSCPAGWNLIDMCQEGPTVKYKCSDNTQTPKEKCFAEGYNYTSASAPYELGSKCPYDGSYYKRQCRSDTPTACKAAGYTRPELSCNLATYNEAACPCDYMWVKCVPK